MDGETWMDGQMNTQTKEQIDRLKDGQTNEWTDKQTKRLVNVLAGWSTNRQTDELQDFLTDIHLPHLFRYIIKYKF